MAIPNSLRYTWARLQPFRLLLLCSGLAVILLGIFIWQRRTHPEWSGLFQVQTPGPNQAANNSSLTPEEQAGIAEIDSLSVLLSDLPLDAEQAPDSLTGDLGEDGSLADGSLLSALQASASPGSDGQNEASSQSPFAAYLDRYDFANRGATGSNGSSVSNPFDATPESSQEPAASLLNLSNLFRSGGNGAASTTATAMSPLQHAINQQAMTRRAQAGRETAEPEATEGSGTTSTLPGVTTAEPAPVPLPMIPTTPQMSPPPGTTGYTVPSTLNLSPPEASTNTNAYTNLFPNTPSATGGASGRTTGGIAPVSPGNGVGPSGLPSPNNTGTTYNQPDARLQEASPFAVPGAPGSRTGGGYIYTFSDPNGPVD